MEKEQITDWAYITAWNPYSNDQTEEFNRAQQAEWLQKLSDYKVWPEEGKGRDGVWPAEESMFVAGISREKARYFGSDYGQYAILVNGRTENWSC